MMTIMLNQSSTEVGRNIDETSNKQRKQTSLYCALLYLYKIVSLEIKREKSPIEELLV